MKTIASALIALALLSGVVATSASAAQNLAQQLESEGRFGHAI
jgi:uroporphyrinogen-III synthase